MNILERFKRKYIIDPISGCWLWQGWTNNHGYGFFRYEGRDQGAHCVSYQLYKGSIPSKLEIDHICHNGSGCRAGRNCFHRRCVNPQHLEIVPHQINISRGNRSLTSGAFQKRKTHCPLGHPYSGKNLYINTNGARSCVSCERARVKKFRQLYGRKKIHG